MGNEKRKISMEVKKPKICVVSFPMASALVVYVFLYDLIKILEPVCDAVYVITSNIPKDKTFSEKIKIKDIKTAMHFKYTIHPAWRSTLLQFFKIIVIQIKMCWILAKISKDVELVLFYVGGAYLFPPVLTTKFLRKKVIISAINFSSVIHRKTDNAKFFSKGDVFSIALNVLERANFYLSDLIITESKGVIDLLSLGKYRQKLNANAARYINLNLFQIKKDLRERINLVGYIGRLEQRQKAVMHLVKAIPLILEKQDNIKFFLGGNGPLYDKIKAWMMNNKLFQKVEMPGWIPHDELADYLNELKVFILPSYAEGLPTGVLEAMACGTPVLATPVGGIPDIIKDGETGFIMENNSPECIAKNITRVLNHPNLEEITKNARSLIEKEYTYGTAVERYKEILKRLVDDNNFK